MNNLTPETTPIPAQARDTSRRDWFKSAALMGAASVATLGATRVAQAQTTPAPADPNASAPVVVPESAVQNTMPANPTGVQAVNTNSIVVDGNPNNPAITIPGAAKTATPGDVEILNFALGLEYLEADFYARIVQAHEARPYLTPRQFQVANGLARDEAAHVTSILEILTAANATPAAKPTFQFPSNVFVAQLAFLDLAAIFEETGVGAYLGAAPKVTSGAALRFAASIYGIETRHTGLIRYLAGKDFAPTAAEVPLTVEQVLTRVRPFILA